MLKGMARDPLLPADVLRAVIAGTTSDGYTPQDMAFVLRRVRELGWSFSLVPEKEQETFEFADAEQYQAELRRLHELLRAIRQELDTLKKAAEIAQKVGAATGAKRQDQLKRTGCKSIDDMVVELLALRERFRRLSDVATNAAYAHEDTDLMRALDEIDPIESGAKANSEPTPVESGN